MNVKLNRRQQTIGMVATSMLLLTVFVTSTQVQAQWSGSPNIYYNGGNVGIGTASPGSKLQVNGDVRVASGTGSIYFDTNSRLYSDGSYSIVTDINGYPRVLFAKAAGDSGNSYYDLGNNSNANHYFRSALGAADLLVIKNNGSVGIGTSNPLSRFWLKGDTTTGGIKEVATFEGGGLATTDGVGISFTGYGGSVSGGTYPTWRTAQIGVYTSQGGVNGWGGSFAFIVNRGNSATDMIEAMRIKDNGNVGIGTVTPGYKLDVNGEINATGLRINGTPISTGGGSSLWNGSGSIYYNGGNVGIGTTSPGAKLDVNGGIYSSGQIRANSLSLYLWGTDASGTNRVLSGAPNVESQDTQGLELGTSGSAPLVLYTAATERMRIDSSGVTTVTGNLTVSGNIAAKYQDVAEWVESSEQLAAGTVVVLDSSKSNQVIASSVSYDTRVAGVISAQPGIALGEKSESKVLVATTGRVKVKVDATKSPIQIGDLLVTSDVPGVAMKSQPVEFAGRKMHMPGTLIGKALEPLVNGKGEILVLLSLQ